MNLSTLVELNVKIMESVIEYKGVEFDVEFDYQPYEPEVTYYSDGSGYPGCAEQVEVYKIEHEETCFMEFFENDMQIIEEIIIEKLSQENEY